MLRKQSMYNLFLYGSLAMSIAVADEQGSFEFCYDQKGLSKLLEFIKKQDHSLVGPEKRFLCKG